MILNIQMGWSGAAGWLFNSRKRKWRKFWNNIGGKENPTMWWFFPQNILDCCTSFEEERDKSELQVSTKNIIWEERKRRLIVEGKAQIIFIFLFLFFLRRLQTENYLVIRTSWLHYIHVHNLYSNTKLILPSQTSDHHPYPPVKRS